MDELDSVVLVKDFKDLKKGAVGCIVHKYDEHNFEVEFFDKNGNTIDVYTISDEFIILNNTH